MSVLYRLFGTGEYWPHEYCYRQDSALVGLHFWSDLLIGVSYVLISLTLLHLVRQARHEIPFSWMFLAFGGFIIACGATHFMEVLTLTQPVYWAAGAVKAVTALASVTTAVVLPPLIPRAVRLVRYAHASEKTQAELVLTNLALEKEVAERRRAEDAVRQMNEELESRVRERTAQLARANQELLEKAALEEQLRDAQKLESLGLIAGGVAHDFNNLLVGIMGNASLALEDLPATSPVRPMLQQVVSSSERAAHLTQQLLAYSGKGRFISTKVNLSSMVRETVEIMKTTIPCGASLELHLDQKLPAVEADPGQMQQVVLNLVMNAAEAIGENQGSIVVTTETERVTEQSSQEFRGEVRPGRYVALEVRDSGHGMDEATQAKIFDPFFSTKFTGRGLGLSAVQGIVRSHHGTILVKSAAGQGATFRILLPASEPVKPADLQAENRGGLRGGGKVLVIDDDEAVRSTARSALTHFGYDVIAAPDGQSGIDLFRKQAAGICVVLLDMTMPGMGGEEVFRHIRTIRADVPVIVSSGYDEAEAVRRFTPSDVSAFMQKPYSAARLASAIKRVLN